MDYSIFSNEPVNVEPSELSTLNIKTVDFNIQNSTLPEGHNLVVVEDSQFDVSLLSKITTGLTPRGFVLLVENISAKPSSDLKSTNLQIVSVTENNNKKYFLLKKVIQCF